MSPRSLLRRARSWLVVPVTAALAVTLLGGPARAVGNPVTPGDFLGYGFDQCHAPSQSAMTRWLSTSPYLAVGIYISGASRGCLDQPNLTPTWVSTQLAAGWKLLPITLGPQASCSTRFPRYGNDPVISSSTTDTYAKARAQGRLEAERAVNAAKALGIVPGSILWYDLEAWNISSSTACNRSALWFMNAWSYRLHQLGYLSGYYSSAGSGIKVMDNERQNHAAGITVLPDYLWIAEWHSSPTVDSRYIGNDGWMPHRRVHQYQGGHNETWGGVTINIDQDWLDVGRGAIAPAAVSHCQGTAVDFASYATLRQGVQNPAQVMAVKCLLKEAGYYPSSWMGGTYNATLMSWVRKFRVAKGLSDSTVFGPSAWEILHADGGARPILKFGSSSDAVRRVQRTLNAVSTARLPVTGVFDLATSNALKAYQRRLGLANVNGIVSWTVWDKFHHGIR